MPIDGVVRRLWREAVVETDAKGRTRINRITYEICVLEALRERLRCKEIWVVGANRYRNPDEDLPADFAEQRTTHYAALGLPLDADASSPCCRRRCARRCTSSTPACCTTST